MNPYDSPTSVKADGSASTPTIEPRFSRLLIYTIAVGALVAITLRGIQSSSDMWLFSIALFFVMASTPKQGLNRKIPLTKLQIVLRCIPLLLLLIAIVFAQYNVRSDGSHTTDMALPVRVVVLSGAAFDLSRRWWKWHRASTM